MAMPPPGPPGPDLYTRLGVARESSGADIAHAYRRRARDIHPDSRPHDPDAPARFRALAEAYHVLSDPARRAAYDRTLRPEPVPATRAVPPQGRTTAQPPLWAGPVVIEGGRELAHDERARLAALAELAARFRGPRGHRSW